MEIRVVEITPARCATPRDTSASTRRRVDPHLQRREERAPSPGFSGAFAGAMTHVGRASPPPVPRRVFGLRLDQRQQHLFAVGGELESADALGQLFRLAILQRPAAQASRRDRPNRPEIGLARNKGSAFRPAASDSVVGAGRGRATIRDLNSGQIDLDRLGTASLCQRAFSRPPVLSLASLLSFSRLLWRRVLPSALALRLRLLILEFRRNRRCRARCQHDAHKCSRSPGKGRWSCPARLSVAPALVLAVK